MTCDTKPFAYVFMGMGGFDMKAEFEIHAITHVCQSDMFYGYCNIIHVVICPGSLHDTIPARLTYK